MDFIILQGDTFFLNFFEKIVASNSIGLMFSIVGNVILARAYNAERNYNRERDLSVTKIITLMQARLEDLQQLNVSFNEVGSKQDKQLLLTDQVIKDLEKLSGAIK